jgi:ABC-type oligopeptide transport system ATPase subunit
LHPYTQSRLLSAVPEPDPAAHRTQANRIVLQGDVPSPVESAAGLQLLHPLPEGHGYLPAALDPGVSAKSEPEDSFVACHLYSDHMR